MKERVLAPAPSSPGHSSSPLLSFPAETPFGFEWAPPVIAVRRNYFATGEMNAAHRRARNYQRPVAAERELAR